MPLSLPELRALEDRVASWSPEDKTAFAKRFTGVSENVTRLHRRLHDFGRAEAHAKIRRRDWIFCPSLRILN
ncbi:MAG: hypothetical protein AAFU79_04225, partial [Myxococcota bacterium]